MRNDNVGDHDDHEGDDDDDDDAIVAFSDTAKNVEELRETEATLTARRKRKHGLLDINIRHAHAHAYAHIAPPIFCILAHNLFLPDDDHIAISFYCLHTIFHYNQFEIMFGFALVHSIHVGRHYPAFKKNCEE